MFLDWAHLEWGPSVNTWMCNLQLRGAQACFQSWIQLHTVSISNHTFWQFDRNLGLPPNGRMHLHGFIQHCSVAVHESLLFLVQEGRLRCLVSTWWWVRRQYVAYRCYNVCRMSGGGWRPWAKCSYLAPTCHLCTSTVGCLSRVLLYWLILSDSQQAHVELQLLHLRECLRSSEENMLSLVCAGSVNLLGLEAPSQTIQSLFR